MDRRYKGKRLARYVADYVVFDLETTGVSVEHDVIIEIAAVKVVKGKVIDTFQTLVNPERPIPSGASRVNGITDDMVADAPLIGEALEAFLGFIGDAVLVGHNIQAFDMNFIYDASMCVFQKPVTNNFIDTLYMARKCLPELNNHKLTDLAAHYHISQEGAHRAFNDCMINQQCYEEMGKIEAVMSFETCPQCGGELIKRNGKFGAFFGCSNYPSCRYTKNA